MRRFRPARREEGAAAVEFALLFLPFLWLVIGGITVGTAFSRQSNVTQAAREASRYGATYDVTAAGGFNAWLTLVDTAVCRSAGNGDDCPPNPPGTTPTSGPGVNAGNPLSGYDYRCVALISRLADGTVDTANTAWMETYTNNVGGNARTTTLPGVAATGGCPSVPTPNLGANSKIVQVVVSRDVKFFLLFANPKLHLDGVSITPYEGDLP